MLLTETIEKIKKGIKASEEIIANEKELIKESQRKIKKLEKLEAEMQNIIKDETDPAPADEEEVATTTETAENEKVANS
jgi:hypothetical protein